MVRRRRGLASDTRQRAVVLWAAVPTVLTIVVEWTALATVSNLTRAFAALPFGAAVAYVVLSSWPGATSNQVD